MSANQGQETQDKISRLLNMDVDTAEDTNVKNILDEITNSNNIETKTNITRQQVIVITRAIWFARRYGIKTLDMYTRSVLLKLLISIDKGGRNDLVNALASAFGWAITKKQNEQVKV